MTINITREKAIKLLTSAVNVNGADYVYPAESGCRYSKGGAPSCIVGYAIDFADHDAFVKLAAFEDKNDTFGIDEIDMVYSGYDTPAIDVSKLIGVTFENDALTLLARAQNLQDRGESWGQAVEKAIANA